MTTTHDKRHGVQKTCACGEARWPKCPHSWYLRWTYEGKRWQESIDKFAGEHVVSERRARELAGDIKEQIKAGTYRAGRGSAPPTTPPAGPTPAPPAPPTPAGLTIAQLGETYLPGAVNHRTSKPLTRSEHWNWGVICTTVITRPKTGETLALGDIPAQALTRFDIEAFRDVSKVKRVVTLTNAQGKKVQVRRGGTVGTNRLAGRLRAFYNWAVRMGHVEETPFRKGGVVAVGKFGEQERFRRLKPGERERLMAAGGQRICDLIEVAEGTCCRKSEVLGMRWNQVRFATNEIDIDPSQTKTGMGRLIPMQKRVRQILERRRLDPTGKPWPPMFYIFGDAKGRRVKSLTTAWETVRLRALGFTGPMRHANNRLTPAARAALKEMNLRWHDLRREGGSLLVDKRVDPRVVQVLLGQQNLATTNKYLKLGDKALHAEISAMEARVEAAERAAANAPMCPENGTTHEANWYTAGIGTGIREGTNSASVVDADAKSRAS